MFKREIFINIYNLIFHNNSRNNTSKYKIGDVVEVISRKQLSKVLITDKSDACIYMGNMLDYCGKKFKVYKLVNNVFDEHRLKMYNKKSTLYILDGLFCNGIVKEFKNRCDRYCPILWQEEWLKKIISICAYWLVIY